MEIKLNSKKKDYVRGGEKEKETCKSFFIDWLGNSIITLNQI